ncbi:GNAT family N-acetyltransferase [Streptomyces sp. SPB074]|uniref:GNAT family N-acetyltransferase n=1 Tax=Streptomyces sp. (strain SPB074) TaxID=465543 RepID=UPI00017F1274|nr:GNAT family protein [Streptomyces sp. SPB074]EDY45067.1 GNAT family acetyltransferase [Streptomyces sp. SPB074]
MSNDDRTILSEDILLRPLAAGDAPLLLDAYLRNRDRLQPFEPVRTEEFYTLPGQRERLASQLAAREAGTLFGWVLTDGERVIGTITLSQVVRGPLNSANLGYWVDTEYAGRGLTGAAAAFVVRYADEVLGLHRVEAGTLLDNLASQRVLAKTGFTEFGVAPRMLHINGAWRDHKLFQLILNDLPPR